MMTAYSITLPKSLHPYIDRIIEHGDIANEAFKELKDMWYIQRFKRRSGVATITMYLTLAAMSYLVNACITIRALDASIDDDTRLYIDAIENRYRDLARQANKDMLDDE